MLLNNLKIVKKKDAPQIAEETEIRIQRILNRDEAYGTRYDTFNNSMFAFAKDVQTAAECNPADNDLHEVAYRMKLFTAEYSIKRLGNHNSFSYQNITALPGSTYLNPCFAKDTHSNRVIHLSQPDGFIIIHQNLLGSNSKAIITRIDTANKKMWETATGVSTKIGNCMVAGNYCIITTNSAYMVSPHIGKDALMIINLENGKIIKPSLNL